MPTKLLTQKEMETCVLAGKAAGFDRVRILTTTEIVFERQEGEETESTTDLQSYIDRIPKPDKNED